MAKLRDLRYFLNCAARAAAALALLVFTAGPALAQERDRVVRGLEFTGNHYVDDATLSAVIATTNSSWFARVPPFKWFGLGEKRIFDEVEFRRDVLRLALFYKRSGYLDVQVDTLVLRSEKDVRVTFAITEGPPTIVTALTVTGLDSVPQNEKIVGDLPLNGGDPFNRFLMQASVDTIVSRLRDRGFPAVAVFRNFQVDRAGRTASVELDVAPGTPARVGSMEVVGTRKVDSALVRRMLSVRQGDLYSQQRLFDSQRILYQTQMFRFVSVQLDTARYTVGDTIAPLRVQVNEGHMHRVRGTIGFGTTDCFRGGMGWTGRNFWGEGRTLDVSTRISKVGVGSPLDWGAQNSLCGALKEDSIGSSLLNYGVTASIRKPVFLSSRNTATYSVFAERRSEYKVYRREEVGTSFGVSRETEKRVQMNGTYRLSYGRTVASSASFCAFFSTCQQEDIDRLRQRQVLATLTAGLSWPRSDNPLDPTRGWVGLLEATHSSKFIGSSATQEFTRLGAEAAIYRTIARGVVLSGRVRGGMLFAPKVVLGGERLNFVPPDERFYAGGPNDVRGYEQNELGPVVYVVDSSAIAGGSVPQSRVRFSATGGNTLAIANAELRVPSPVFRQRLRFAFFVDAGTVFQREETALSPVLIRVTPGVGLRIATPLGPARLDVAYNPYDRQPGALYTANSDGELQLFRDRYVLPRQRNYTIHFAVGQPF
jgi:outer membrane protein assembly factor BamA